MNSQQDFKKLARRTKWHRWLITGGIALGVCLGAGVLAVQTTAALTRRGSAQANDFMTIASSVLAPNIQISDQFLTNNGDLGGQVVSHRYKEIEGQRVAWSPLVASYSWLRGGELPTALNATDQAKQTFYDRTTQLKIPMFYNVHRATKQTADDQLAHELGRVEQTRGQVAEVALSFKTPLSYRQIQQWLPQGVHAVWYWLGVSGKQTSTIAFDNNFLGMAAGQPMGRVTNLDYRDFRQQLQAAGRTRFQLTYNGFSVFKYAATYAKRYPTLGDARFAGVIVTGTSAHLKRLGQPTWVAASSAGIVTPERGIH